VAKNEAQAASPSVIKDEDIRPVPHVSPEIPVQSGQAV
jgi:hypothetical protein